MIGHYLLALTPEQEDRVLTEHLARAPNFVTADGCRCLVGVVHALRLGCRPSLSSRPRSQWGDMSGACVGSQFDFLCARFGELRVNAAIRNRILANQACRVVAPRREVVREAV